MLGQNTEPKFLDNNGKPATEGKGNPSLKQDAKNQKSDNRAPEADPALMRYGIYAESALLSERGEAVETTLPLRLEKGSESLWLAILCSIEVGSLDFLSRCYISLILNWG